MTHDELLAKVNALDYLLGSQSSGDKAVAALRAVVELHKPLEHRGDLYCLECRLRFTPGDLGMVLYPCWTIRAIEKELT